MKEIITEMAVLDVQDAENDLQPGMKLKLTTLHNEYDIILLHREISRRQKTRFTWINEGDVNLSLFPQNSFWEEE